jgi:hypothetical protein
LNPNFSSCVFRDPAVTMDDFTLISLFNFSVISTNFQISLQANSPINHILAFVIEY